MDIKNAHKVLGLSKDLKNLEAIHENLKNLTTLKKGRFGLNAKAFIQLGGDSYGNGSNRKVEFDILEIPELVRYCHKLESDAWGKVVTMRATLRQLGVAL